VETVTGGSGNDDGLQAVAPGITSRHQARACGRTHALSVELSELRATGGELINVRRLDVGGAVEADVFPAEVVGDDVDDVGFAQRLGCAANPTGGYHGQGYEGTQHFQDGVFHGGFLQFERETTEVNRMPNLC